MTRILKREPAAGRRKSDSLVPPQKQAVMVSRPSILSAPKRLLETLRRAPYNFVQSGFYPHTLLTSRIAGTLAMREPGAVKRAYAIYLASLRSPDQLITFRREGASVVSHERLRLVQDKVVIDHCSNPYPISDELALRAIAEDRIIYLARNIQFSIERAGFGEVSTEKMPKGLAGSRLLIPFGKNYGLVEVSGADLRLIGFWQTHSNALFSARDIANIVFMREIADTDALTGLFNRRVFDETLNQYYGDYLAEGINSAIVMLDIDNFKGVNDIYGHLAGDTVLAQVASIISRTLRSNDVVTLTRYGGEEFAILLPGADTQGGAIAAERCRAQLEANPSVFENRLIQVTGSFGVSSFLDGERLAKGEFNPESEINGIMILPEGLQDSQFVLELTQKMADEAVYTAKERGRNLVVGSTFEPKTRIFSFRGPK